MTSDGCDTGVCGSDNSASLGKARELAGVGASDREC